MINSVAIKNSLLAIVFLVVFAPLIQSNLNLFKIKDLKGFFTRAEDVDISFDRWNSAEYQEVKEKYLTENFGFRNTLIRVMNQIRYSLFKKTAAPEVIFGKENCLFTKVYLDSYTGKNFIGLAEVKRKSLLVKELQDKMSAVGKIYVPVIAPNKARYYSEYLPDNVYKVNCTNYEMFTFWFKKLGVKYIDFEDYFLKAKKTTKYPLFSKSGIHWNSYGQTIVADSIINYLNVNFNLVTNKLVYEKNISLSDSISDADDDILGGMNLFVDQLEDVKYVYPVCTFKKVTDKKPALLTIGDSFNYGIQRTNFQNEVFSDYKLLYYFKEVVPYTGDNEAFQKLNLKDEINRHDVILTLFTEQNFVNYGCGFIEKAIDILDGKDDGSINVIPAEDMKEMKAEKVKEMIQFIKKDSKWLSALKERSAKENVPLDTLIKSDAIFQVDILSARDKDYLNSALTKKKKQIKDIKVKEMMEYIRKDSKWMDMIEERSEKENISVDTLIKKDAIFQVDLLYK